MTVARARLAAALLALGLGACAGRAAPPDRARPVLLAGGFEALGAAVELRSANYQVTPAEPGVALRHQPSSAERLAAAAAPGGSEAQRAPVVLAGAAPRLPRPDRCMPGLDRELLRQGRVPDDQLLRPG